MSILTTPDFVLAMLVMFQRCTKKALNARNTIS